MFSRLTLFRAVHFQQSSKMHHHPDFTLSPNIMCCGKKPSLSLASSMRSNSGSAVHRSCPGKPLYACINIPVCLRRTPSLMFTMHCRKRGGASHPRIWGLWMSLACPHDSGCFRTSPPATAHKALLRSARRACFDDMAPNLSLSLILGDGASLRMGTCAHVGIGLACDLPGVLPWPSLASNCTSRERSWARAQISLEDDGDRPSGRARDGLEQSFQAHSGAGMAYATMSDRHFGRNANAGDARYEKLALETPCGPGHILFLQPYECPDHPSADDCGPPI